MTAGYSDCAQPIFDGEQVQVEAWGFSPSVDGEPAQFYRGSGNRGLAPLSPIGSLGTGGTMPIGWESDFELDGGPSFHLSASGEVELFLDEETVLEDPFGPREEPYSCGWPNNNPGNLSTTNLLAEGAVIPTALLEDRCGEMVNLWDFFGSWVILDTAQPDCPPCRTMASELPAFIEGLHGEGFDVYGVTVLGAGLSASSDAPAESDYLEWLEEFGEEEPVLRDTGYGSSVFGRYFAKEFGFPSYALVGPDMTMVQSWVGFSSERLDEIAALIRGK